MMAFDTTKPEIDTTTPSKCPLSLLDHPENHLAGTRLPTFVPHKAKSKVALRDASKRHDGKMLAPAAILDVQLDRDSWSSSHERMRRSARRLSRPTGSGFESRPSTGWEPPEVDLIRRASADSRVRPLRVVPGDVVVELARERSLCSEPAKP